MTGQEEGLMEFLRFILLTSTSEYAGGGDGVCNTPDLETNKPAV